jgi:hypothetical protein
MARSTATGAGGKPARQHRPKPPRHVRLLIPPDGLASGVVRITVGTASTDYAVREFKSDLGGRAFELTKLGLESDGEVYHTLLTGNAHTDSCTCKGFARWSHCKHSGAVAALVAAGRLPGRRAA